MTVSNTEYVKDFTGDGSTKTIPFNFHILAPEHLTVTVDGAVKALGTDYTIDGVGDDDGGSVTFVVAPPENSAVKLERLVDLLQQTSILNRGVFYPKVHEYVFDKLTMAIQQLARGIASPGTDAYQQIVDIATAIAIAKSSPVLDIANLAQSIANSAQNSATSAQQTADNSWLGLSQFNSVNCLTNANKIELIRSWKSELQTQAQLDAQASTYGITTEKTAYDSAITALSTALIAAGAPSNWASVWPDGTTLTATGIINTISNCWVTIVQKRANLNNAILAAAQTATFELAVSDALTKANAAQLKTPSIATFASTALPALPNASYVAGSCWLTTDGKEYQVTPNGSAWQQVAYYATALVGQLMANQITVVNFEDQWPNGDSAITPPSGYTSADPIYDPEFGYYQDLGTSDPSLRRRWINVASSSIHHRVPVKAGEKYYFSAKCHNSGAVGGQIVLYFEGADKTTQVGSTQTNTSVLTAGWESLAITSNTVPTGAAWMHVYVQASSSGSYFDDIYLRKMADANLIVDGVLQALFARIARAIQSTNYVAGSAGNSPVGFCLSSTPFTTTFKDGTTDSGCLMEVGGSANFGGYKVATINTQVMTAINRIVNGSFWMSFSPWSAQPRFVYTITANTNQNIDYYGSTVTASQNLNGPGYTTGTIRLKFTPSATFVLNSGGAASPGPAGISFRVTVYMKNHYTGTQTTLYQQSASAVVGSPWSPGQQSINVTSLLSTIPAGYGVAAVIDNIYIQDFNGSNASSNSYTGTIDVTGFELIF